jgi:hypothetical protein
MTEPALSPGDLYWIARYRSEGYSYSKLAKSFSASPTTISKALRDLFDGSTGPYGEQSNFFDEELGTGWREGSFPNKVHDWATSKIQLRIEGMCLALGWRLMLGVNNKSWYIFPKERYLKDLRTLLGDDFSAFAAPDLDIAKEVVSVFLASSDGEEAFKALLKQFGPVYKFNGCTVSWC